LTVRVALLLAVVALASVLLAQPHDELHRAAEEPPLPEIAPKMATSIIRS
jgi:hypothetical protein